MKDNSVKRFIAPQSCDNCPDAPANVRCSTDFNCTLYVGHVFNPDKIAENARGYQTMQEWERDVEELKRLMGVEGA